MNVNECEQATEKVKHCLIFSREIIYISIVLCSNILWLEAVKEITARQTRTNFAKFIKVCSTEYLTTQIELMLPTSKYWTVHKIIQYLTLGLSFSLWNIYHSTTAYFFDPPVDSTNILHTFSPFALYLCFLLLLFCVTTVFRRIKIYIQGGP